jgi:hypothetical protein
MNNSVTARPPIETGQTFRLPAGHAWQQPEMTVVVTAVKPDEWVAYENATNRGCSRYDYFESNADPMENAR